MRWLSARAWNFPRRSKSFLRCAHQHALSAPAAKACACAYLRLTVKCGHSFLGHQRGGRHAVHVRVGLRAPSCMSVRAWRLSWGPHALPYWPHLRLAFGFLLLGPRAPFERSAFLALYVRAEHTHTHTHEHVACVHVRESVLVHP